MSKDKAYVASLPVCDFCPATAKYDGKTASGPWAYLCAAHFKTQGVGLGTGKGQRLVVGEKPTPEYEGEAATYYSALKDICGDDEDAIQAEMEDLGYG